MLATAAGCHGWLTECEHGWLTECEHGWLTECESPLIDPSLLLWVTPHCSCGSQVNGCFDAGMAYVSLSRVRTLGGLRFQKHCPNSLDCNGCAACACSLTPHAVRAHPEVKAFYAMSHELSATAAAFAERLEEAVAAAPTVPAPTVPAPTVPAPTVPAPTIPAPTDPALAAPSEPNASLPLPLPSLIAAAADNSASRSAAAASAGCNSAAPPAPPAPPPAPPVPMPAPPSCLPNCMPPLGSHVRKTLSDAARALRCLGPREIAELAASLAQRIDVPQALRVQAHALHVKAIALSPGDVGDAPKERDAIQGWWTVPPVQDTKVRLALG